VCVCVLFFLFVCLVTFFPFFAFLSETFVEVIAWCLDSCAEKSEQLDWDTRVTIIMGAAKGLAYLHHDCSPRIIHRDIKSSNILLDGNFAACVSDFGLAKLLQDEESHKTTIVAGTFGYLAPGWMMNEHYYHFLFIVLMDLW